jgi:hypothetical protein
LSFPSCLLFSSSFNPPSLHNPQHSPQFIEEKGEIGTKQLKFILLHGILRENKKNLAPMVGFEIEIYVEWGKENQIFLLGN